VESLSKAGYQYRRHLGIITFGNNEVHTLLQPQRAPKNIRPVLDGILAGGGTPFTKALDYADCLLNRQQSKPFACHVYIITDGRISDPAINHPLLRKFPVNLIDVESGRVKLGLVKRLATHIGANYQQLSATH
jgi:Mg-chelatase subunit ChlD